MMPAHFMVQVRDLPGAVAFYECALNFAVVDRHAYAGAALVYMRGPQSAFELELLAPAAWPFAAAPELGRTHLAFTVPDLEAEHRRLVGLGIAAEPIQDYRANGMVQTRYFYFTDPEGNQIEFLEPAGRYADRSGSADARTASAHESEPLIA